MWGENKDRGFKFDELTTVPKKNLEFEWHVFENIYESTNITLRI